MMAGASRGWRYFGRNGGFGEPFELYRIPDNGKAFDEQSVVDVERLRRDGTWAHDPSIHDGIWRELFLGGFSPAQDELSEDEAMRLARTWLDGEWPGRD